MPATMTIARPKVPSGWRRAKLNADASSHGRRVAGGSVVMAVIAALPSAEADARVEPRVEHVDHADW